MTLDLSFGGFIWPPGRYELPQNPFQCFFNKFQKWLTRFIPKSSSKCLPISVFRWSTGSIPFCRIFPPGRSGEENGNLSHITTRENQFFLFCSFSMSRQQQNAFSVPPACLPHYVFHLLTASSFLHYVHSCAHRNGKSHKCCLGFAMPVCIYSRPHFRAHRERNKQQQKSCADKISVTVHFALFCRCNRVGAPQKCNEETRGKFQN